MSEEIDKELSKRIAEVFENYEDTASANQGWLLLREKFPAKKQRRIAPIWWSAAASLLLLSLAGLWFFNRPEKLTQTVAKRIIKKTQEPVNTEQSKNHQPDSIQDSQQHITEPRQYTVVAPKNSVKQHNTPLQQTGEHVGQSSAQLKTKDSVVKVLSQQPTPAAAMVKIKISPVDTLVGASTQPINSSPKNAQLSAIAAISSKQDSTTQGNSAVLARQDKQTLPTLAKGNITDSAAMAKSSGMDKYLAIEQKNENHKKAKTTTNVDAEKKVLFSVYAATYFNYAEGSKSQLNTGAGLSTDIRLTGNLKLSTGMAIAKNTLNYSGQPTRAGILSDARSASAVSDAAPQSSLSNNNTSLGVVPLAVAVSPVVSAYNVSLTGLDIPLNIKYEFNPHKTDSYIAAGLSSGTFITETYNYSYANSPNALGASYIVPDATTSRSFSHFDFARTLNLSVGMGYQITKHNRLVIEPFLKYPLSGLGSQQIRFGAGGINLRFKFQQAKK